MLSRTSRSRIRPVGATTWLEPECRYQSGMALFSNLVNVVVVNSSSTLVKDALAGSSLRYLVSRLDRRAQHDEVGDIAVAEGVIHPVTVIALRYVPIGGVKRQRRDADNALGRVACAHGDGDVGRGARGEHDAELGGTAGLGGDQASGGIDADRRRRRLAEDDVDLAGDAQAVRVAVGGGDGEIGKAVAVDVAEADGRVRLAAGLESIRRHNRSNGPSICGEQTGEVEAEPRSPGPVDDDSSDLRRWMPRGSA